ncbi:MAG TPA: glycoside hydrolase family 88 protein [Terracidiphilus sp.]|jgi:unsaturated rhamnogalacturonyl hydrolase|nr:glycoside hydrolase family 88 protein [Terracidiphilus sp.]
MKILRTFAFVFLLAATVGSAFAAANTDEYPWSQRVADSAMARWPQGHIDGPNAKPAFKYELGTLLQGIDDVYLNTADPRYYNYIKSAVDELVTADGAIPTYKSNEYELDSILLGRQLLQLFGMTRDKRYLTAAKLLVDQLAHQPRNASGGYWHKERYPNQMWLDGLYMAEPFRAEYASISHHPEEFSDITHQFVLVAEHMRDPKTGLLYHGWDESKQQRWANKTTGNSPEFWGRAMGWYMMALVDTIPYYSDGDPGKKQLIAILNEEAAALVRVQDAQSGLWYEVLDKGGAKGNYLESSASCMFVYALAKGVRRGYLPEHYLANAERGYKGILTHFIKVGPDGDVSLTGTVRVGGLGGEPYRDGSYAYYLSEKVVANDPKGVGAFIMAASEMDNAQNAKLGRGDTVLMDGWFNSQNRPDAFGKEVIFHYKWDTQDNPGYSLLGHIFRNFGAQTKELDAEPTLKNLRDAQVYMIVSPDNLDKNPHPHFATAEDATQIAAWVKAGGVLAIMENDTSFADLDHFNAISEKFGIHFNSVLRKHVVGTNWEQGKIQLDGSGPIFHHPHTIYVKDVCTISLKPPAVSVLKEGDDIFMATAKYGKGTVFAFVDPWLYNEYTDGRKLPATYDNYAAGVEFARWLLRQVPR